MKVWSCLMAVMLAATSAAAAKSSKSKPADPEAVSTEWAASAWKKAAKALPATDQLWVWRNAHGDRSTIACTLKGVKPKWDARQSYAPLEQAESALQAITAAVGAARASIDVRVTGAPGVWCSLREFKLRGMMGLVTRSWGTPSQTEVTPQFHRHTAYWVDASASQAPVLLAEWADWSLSGVGVDGTGARQFTHWTWETCPAPEGVLVFLNLEHRIFTGEGTHAERRVLAWLLKKGGSPRPVWSHAYENDHTALGQAHRGSGFAVSEDGGNITVELTGWENGALHAQGFVWGPEGFRGFREPLKAHAQE